MAWCWYYRMWLITGKQDFEECSSKVCTCEWCMGCRMVERWQLNDPEIWLNYVNFGETPDLCDVWEGIWGGLKSTLTMNGTHLSTRVAIEMRRKTYFAATPAPNAKQQHVRIASASVLCTLSFKRRRCDWSPQTRNSEITYTHQQHHYNSNRHTIEWKGQKGQAKK